MTTHKEIVGLMKEAHYIITEGEAPPDVEEEDRLADPMEGLVLVEAIGHLVSWISDHANPPPVLVTYWSLAMVSSFLLVTFYDTTSIASKLGLLSGIIVILEILLDALFRRLRIRKARGLIDKIHESIRGISTVAGA